MVAETPGIYITLNILNKGNSYWGEYFLDVLDVKTYNAKLQCRDINIRILCV